LSAPAIFGGCFGSLQDGNTPIGLERTSIEVDVKI